MSKTNMKKIAIVIAFLSSLFTQAYAYEESATVAYTSNYIFRGLTQTDDKSAIQGTYEISQSGDSGFYAGVFASNVERGNADGLEVDLYGGLRFGTGSNGRFNFDLGIIEYLYTNSNFRSSFHELYFGLGTDDVFAKVFWNDRDTSYLEIGARFNVTGKLNLDLHFGRADTANDIGATLSIDFDGLLVAGSMAYHDSNNESKGYLTIALEL